MDSIPPCDLPNTPPSEDCESVCIYCDFIQGFAGTNTGLAPSSLSFFCGSIENDQWLGFVAGATTATFTVSPISGSCQNGNGLQLALYDACGGPFLQCNSGCSGCGEIPSSITVTTMIPGHSYLLVIDG